MTGNEKAPCRKEFSGLLDPVDISTFSVDTSIGDVTDRLNCLFNVGARVD